MTIDVFGPGASRRVIPHATDFGNVHCEVYNATLAALGQDETIALGPVPAHCKVVGFELKAAALGANTSVSWGYESRDGGTSQPAAFAATAATTSASTGRPVFDAIDLGDDDWLLVAKNTGTGDATGAVEVKVFYVWVGD